MIQAYFLSDLHLKTEQESNSHTLLRFLHSISQKQRHCTHLFLVGDIFDLWIHNHRYFVDKFTKIVNAIRVIVSMGIEVHYFEGNHDIHLFKFWQQEVGVRVHDGPEFFQLGPHNVRVEHGDFMNPDDKAYLFLRKFLRSGPMTWVAQKLPGQVVRKIGERASQASRQYTSNQKSLHEEKVKKFMHAYADQAYSEKKFNYLITGHTHVEDIYSLSDADYSINLGSWFDGQKVLRLNESGHQFENLSTLFKK